MALLLSYIILAQINPIYIGLMYEGCVIILAPLYVALVCLALYSADSVSGANNVIKP